MNKEVIKAIVQMIISVLTTILTLMSGTALGFVHLAAPLQQLFN